MAKIATKPRFGPADHGRLITDEVAESADYVGGYKYEVIDGKLYVTPRPNPAECILENWLYHQLDRYSEKHPDIINYVSNKPRVYLPNRRRSTIPEPDIAVYADFPHSTPISRLHWRNISPILVIEVMVEGEFEKDLSRNPLLFHAVPSIREYWVLNGSEQVSEPTLIQHVRTAESWEVTTHAFESKFTTPLSPDFKLVLAPRRRSRQ